MRSHPRPTRKILHADNDLEAFISAAHGGGEADPEPVILEM